MRNYIDVCTRFVSWARETHACKTLDDARQYTGEYLQMRQIKGLSAYTVRRDAAGIAKMYRCKTTELGAELPIRRRGDITQHRRDTASGQFSEARNADLVALCKATGLRRHEVAQLKPEDVCRQPDGSVAVHVVQGKGGKERTITALNDAPARLAEKACAEGRAFIIDHIPNRAPIHRYRADFARADYERRARDVSTLKEGEVYRCRRAGTHDTMVGKCFDRAAMLETSKQLGHSRLDVMTHYLYDR